MPGVVPSISAWQFRNKSANGGIRLPARSRTVPKISKVKVVTGSSGVVFIGGVELRSVMEDKVA